MLPLFLELQRVSQVNVNAHQVTYDLVLFKNILLLFSAHTVSPWWRVLGGSEVLVFEKAIMLL